MNVSWEHVLLVMCLVAGVKRHLPKISGAWTLAIAAVAAVIVTYDYQLPVWAASFPQAAKVLAYAIGGHAYIKKTAERFGVKLPFLAGLPASPEFDREAPTKPQGRTLPPSLDSSADAQS
jgi:hypothetical protein